MIKTKKQALAAIEACKNTSVKALYSGGFGIPRGDGSFSTTNCREVACGWARGQKLWLKERVPIRQRLTDSIKGALAKTIVGMSRNLAEVEGAFGTKKHIIKVVAVQNAAPKPTTHVEMVILIDNIWLNNPAAFSYYLLCLRKSRRKRQFKLPEKNVTGGIDFLKLVKQKGGLDKIFYKRPQTNWKYHKSGNELCYLMMNYVRKRKGRYIVRPLGKGVYVKG